MCGLMAATGKISSNRIKALLSLNEERGTDSVGIAYLSNNETKIAKVAERPCVAVNLTLSKAITEAAISGLMIGHTRQATQGAVNSTNAHPFLMEGIAFAHNGIIINDTDFGQYAVDSESLIHGIKARDFSKYEGPIALLWIEGGKLHAYRCGNPLYRGRHNGTTYLASEGDYLKEIGCMHVKELSEGLIYTFNSPSQIVTERVKKNKLFTSKSFSAAGSYSDYSQGWDNVPDTWKDYKSRYDSHGTALLAEVKDTEIKEDFRTMRDIAAEKDSGMVDNCDCCGQLGELAGGMCLDCITWLDGQGIDRDNPPAWMRDGC
jgi:asparagine synthetase B (glutamine-hydrolysing)